VSESSCFYQKIRKVIEFFLNLSLNLNLAILKMRIAVLTGYRLTLKVFYDRNTLCYAIGALELL
jgi:hypothetical protein